MSNNFFEPTQPTLCARRAFAITPADGADLAPFATRGIYVGGAGDVKVDMVENGTVTFKAVPVGTLLAVQAKRVYATGTTATLLIALF